MGRKDMRAAITEFLENAEFALVGKIYSARPEVVQEQDYEVNRMGEAVASPNGSSAILVVGLPDDRRQRRADTGRGAVNDSHIYKAVIEVFFASTSGDAVKAQHDYDKIIDEIIDAIRAEATLGDPTVVWSAGEYESGIEHVQAEPYTDTDGLTVFIPGAVRFEAWEWIAGNV